MLKNKFLIAILPMLISLVSLPSFAQLQTKSPTESCVDAIKVARTRLRYVVYINHLRVSDVGKYDDSPMNRPFKISFTLKGGSGVAILQSPSLLEEVSKNLMQHCNTVSLVGYTLEGTSDQAVSYGLVDKKVQKIKCVEAGRNAPDLIPWGYGFCF